jgi:hypothetical protein
MTETETTGSSQTSRKFADSEQPRTINVTTRCMPGISLAEEDDAVRTISRATLERDDFEVAAVANVCDAHGPWQGIGSRI